MQVHLEKELARLKRQILTVSAHVEGNLHKAIQSVLSRDVQLAARVVDVDQLIDQMEIDVEEECLKILALHQPVATDLRFLIAVLKMNNDLERIGDLAVNIAERGAQLADRPPATLQLDLSRMAGNAQEMLRLSMDSVVNMDADLARRVCAMDDTIDAQKRDVEEQVKEQMARQAHEVSPLLEMLLIARHIERVADLATNIAEDAIYIAEGEIVRHRRGWKHEGRASG
jgi:phosphate transport system protein